MCVPPCICPSIAQSRPVAATAPDATGESIPIRLFLAGFELTPSMRDVQKKFSVRYFLNLVLVDEEVQCASLSVSRSRAASVSVFLLFHCSHTLCNTSRTAATSSSRKLRCGGRAQGDRARTRRRTPSRSSRLRTHHTRCAPWLPATILSTVSITFKIKVLRL